jgi:hypothetical protein
VIIAAPKPPHPLDNGSPAGFEAPDHAKGRRKASIARAERDRPPNCEITAIAGLTDGDTLDSRAWFKEPGRRGRESGQKFKRRPEVSAVWREYYNMTAIATNVRDLL